MTPNADYVGTDYGGRYTRVPLDALLGSHLPCTDAGGRYGEDACGKCPNCRLRVVRRRAAQRVNRERTKASHNGSFRSGES